jgi:hypothetical protein
MLRMRSELERARDGACRCRAASYILLVESDDELEDRPAGQSWERQDRRKKRAARLVLGPGTLHPARQIRCPPVVV